jgi:tRNA (guanine37-N1)-methyltransferase
MNIHILTIFPEFFKCAEKEGIIKIAEERNALTLFIHNLRDFTTDKHRTTDDTPYGGGAGMVMLAAPLFKGIQNIDSRFGKTYKILFTPQGEKFTQEVAHFLSEKKQLLFIPAHYEGMDERVSELVDMELSLGDFILSGGEVAALAVMDAVARLLPNVLGNKESLSEESFESQLLEYPQYTRPREIGGEKVPDVLISGHHENIRKWRLRESIKRTLVKRPDLILKHNFTEEERAVLKEVLQEINETAKEILK